MKSRTEPEDRGLYAHRDRGAERTAPGFGPGAYGFEGDSARRIGPTIEDDYSDHYGYGSFLGEGGTGRRRHWEDTSDTSDSPGASFSLSPEFDADDSAEELISHAGRGPKGYRRSDELIHDAVCEVLTRHPRIDASEVEVAVQGGVVTLSGRVDRPATREISVRAVSAVTGVVSVVDHLAVAGRAT